MEVGRSRFTHMEVSGSFHGSTWKFPLSVEVEASIASINGSFHEHIPWKLPLLPSIASSTNIFNGSFHELSYTPTYFHLLSRVSQTSTCFQKTNPSPNPKPELPPWNRWKYMEVVCCSMEAGATCMGAGLLPTSMEVGGSFHGSRWK